MLGFHINNLQHLIYNIKHLKVMRIKYTFRILIFFQCALFYANKMSAQSTVRIMKDGSYYYTDSTTTPVIDIKSGLMVKASSIIKDTTEHSTKHKLHDFDGKLIFGSDYKLIGIEPNRNTIEHEK